MESSTKKISIIGLGSMGTMIARLYLQQGYQVTVFNRTAAKAEQLVNEGATTTANVADAITASPLVIICVHDYKASNAIFSSPEARKALAGKTIVQLTTGSPQDARESEIWFNDLKAAYIDGAIQVAPEQMAKPDTTVLLSGAKDKYDEIEQILKILGGNLTFLGDRIGAASAMDLSTLSYIYGAAIGFFQGALIAESEGFDVSRYGQIIADIAPGMGEFLKHEGTVISSGDYTISQSPLSISVEATARILSSAKEAGINTEFPLFAAALLKRAAVAGYGNQEVAALIKVMRE